MVIALVAICAALTCFLLVYLSWSLGGSGEKIIDEGNLTRVRIWYGDDGRNFVDIYLPSTKRVNLAVVVHGGGFVGGSATGKSAMSIVDFFLKRGFAVASIEYRICPRSKWPIPVRDVALGTKAAFEYLEDRNVKVGKSIYIGSSAGAIAGALLIYYPDSDLSLSKYFNGFIGLSGGYCSSIAARKDRVIRTCDITLGEMMPFDKDITPASKVPALLINGVRDKLLDRFAGEGEVNHQAECMKQFLEDHGIPIKVVYLPGGHGDPMSKLGAEDPRVVSAIEEFIGLGHGD